MPERNDERRRRLLALEGDELATRVRQYQIRLETEAGLEIARPARRAAELLEELVARLTDGRGPGRR